MISVVSSTCGAEAEAQKQKQRQVEFTAEIIAANFQTNAKKL
jgi:hypothetical protein